MKFLSLALLGTLLPLAHAIGNAIVFNRCTSTIYVWSVGSSISNYQAVASNQSYTEQYRTYDSTGGITLKITAVADGIYINAPETDFGYTLDNQTIWYDISDVNGDPFANSSVALVPANGACQSFIWADGVPPSGIRTGSCSSDVDVQLTLC